MDRLIARERQAIVVRQRACGIAPRLLEHRAREVAERRYDWNAIAEEQKQLYHELI